jgi:hypothetical protein
MFKADVDGDLSTHKKDEYIELSNEVSFMFQPTYKWEAENKANELRVASPFLIIVKDKEVDQIVRKFAIAGLVIVKRGTMNVMEFGWRLDMLIRATSAIGFISRNAPDISYLVRSARRMGIVVYALGVHVNYAMNITNIEQLWNVATKKKLQSSTTYKYYKDYVLVGRAIRNTCYNKISHINMTDAARKKKPFRVDGLGDEIESVYPSENKWAIHINDGIPLPLQAHEVPELYDIPTQNVEGFCVPHGIEIPYLEVRTGYTVGTIIEYNEGSNNASIMPTEDEFNELILPMDAVTKRLARVSWESMKKIGTYIKAPFYDNAVKHMLAIKAAVNEDRGITVCRGVGALRNKKSVLIKGNVEYPPIEGIIVNVIKAGISVNKWSSIYPVPYTDDLAVQFILPMDTSCQKIVYDGRYWSGYRRMSTEADGLQGSRLYTLFFVRRNMLTYTPSTDGYPIALFSISNERNRKEDVIKFLKTMHRGIFLFPHAGYADIIPSQYGFKQGSVFITTLKDQSFRDNLYMPSDFMDMPCTVSSVNEFIDRNNLVSGYGNKSLLDYEPWSPWAKMWFVVEIGDHVTDFNYGQSYRIKSLTVPLRILYGHDNESLHWLRWKVLIHRYPNAKAAEPKNLKITGIVDGVPIGVAGHMVNTLLAMHYWPMDVRARLNIIRENVAFYFTRKVSEWSKTFSGWADEPNTDPSKLWHNYLEWDLGIDAYIVTALALRLRPDYRAAEYMKKGLQKILKEFPEFGRIPSSFTQ